MDVAMEVSQLTKLLAAAAPGFLATQWCQQGGAQTKYQVRR
jgi:hypothetical protein